MSNETDVTGKRFEWMSRDEIIAWQNERLPIIVKQAAKSPWYSKVFADKGIDPNDIKGLDDLYKLPFTTKADLRESYPYGMLAVPKSEVVRMHTSSGTTGKPTAIMHTKQDVENWSEIMARSMAMAGFSNEDIFQNMSGYGLFSGGLGIHMGSEKLGMWTIPAASGNTARSLMLIRDFGVTGVHATPSYLMHVAEAMLQKGEDPSKLPLKRAICGAEPYTEDMRKKLEQLFDMKVFNNYGLSEMNGPGIAFECPYQTGMHLWEDSYIMEIIDPETMKPVEDGQPGELVLTNLRRMGMPIIRYRTRDLTHIIKGECPCGRVHRRIDRFVGRSDDMLVIKGVNVFPSQIEEVIMRKPWLGGNYLITLTTKKQLDDLSLEVELNRSAFDGSMETLRARKAELEADIKSQLGFGVTVNIVEQGSLPTSEGKAKRVVDKRESI
ncbi:MAG: phenylacetate--CoA ligase [Abditibacteriota bacterium]|nr:phenylacetate--CoA ligase [Abditibacteriota bacterium]